MQILHDPSSSLRLSDFGIAIGSGTDRLIPVMEHLSREGIRVHDISTKDSLVNGESLKLAHDSRYIDDLLNRPAGTSRQLSSCFELYDDHGAPNRYAPELASEPLDTLADRVFRQVNGTIEASLTAMESGASFFLGGGFHHAMSFGGRGFCLVNDIVIAARYLQQQGLARKVWVIDVDAHKGDGTAQICHEDESIHTLSIHMAKGWPLEGPCQRSAPWWIPSDIDIGIDEGNEHLYLESLKKGLGELAATGRADIAYVVQGSDPYEKDQLPSTSLLKLSAKQMLERDQMVHEFLESNGIAHCHLLAGGYGPYTHEPVNQYFSWLKQCGSV